MYIKSRRDPSTLPCGTPQVIFLKSETVLSNFDTLEPFNQIRLH